jgi:glycosyltransferase involved in cell wall biosynthesis
MASLPYFVLSPNTVLSVIGLLRGADKTVPTPADDWREAKVDVIIPALNEEDHIVLCLASVLRQTLQPRRIMLVDDGSHDHTVARAKAFCEFHGVKLAVVQRRSPIGKTPTIKRQARELDSDVEFILDGDTVLESDTYIERTVQELYKAVGIACACGTILPLRKTDRIRSVRESRVQEFVASQPWATPRTSKGWLRDFAKGVTNLYREVLYFFLQRFLYHGQMTFFGSISGPVGCAVAYRRKYVKNMFDYFSTKLGDDLTNSEDIFIGFAMLNEGYRNVQLTDVYARTAEPEVQRLPRQLYSWSSSFLQSCFYFNQLLMSPFKVFKRYQQRRGQTAKAVESESTIRRVRPVGMSQPAMLGADGMLVGRPLFSAAVSMPSASPEWPIGGEAQGGDRRRIGEPYRQQFGRWRTEEYGRPFGWVLLMGAVEKVFFPTILFIMIVLGNWHGLAMTIAAEILIGASALMLVMKGQRTEYFFKGLIVAPIRYALLACELGTIGRFACDIWVTKDRKWRK